MEKRQSNKILFRCILYLRLFVPVSVPVFLCPCLRVPRFTPMCPLGCRLSSRDNNSTCGEHTFIPMSSIRKIGYISSIVTHNFESRQWPKFPHFPNEMGGRREGRRAETREKLSRSDHPINCIHCSTLSVPQLEIQDAIESRRIDDFCSIISVC